MDTYYPAIPSGIEQSNFNPTRDSYALLFRLLNLAPDVGCVCVPAYRTQLAHVYVSSPAITRSQDLITGPVYSLLLC